MTPPDGSEEPARDLSSYRHGIYRGGSAYPLMPGEVPVYRDPVPEDTQPMGEPSPPGEPADPDPLTDSAAHRLMLGTMVAIHQRYVGATEVGLQTLHNIDAASDIVTWRDLVDAVHMRHDLEVRAPRRRFIPGWTITHVEVLSDPSGTRR